MGWLSWLFGKKKEPIDPDAEPAELWSCEGKSSSWRWQEEVGQSYALRILARGPHLHLYRDHLFAWSLDPLFRYRDFVVEAELGLTSSGYASGGLILRHMDDANFYSVLVSNKGSFRVDAIFNATPFVLIPWTELPGPLTERFRLMAAFRGSSLVIAYNGLWAGEASDTMIEKGRIGLAGQTYEATHLELQLYSIRLESREVEVEHALEDLENMAARVPEQRLRLAESLAAGRLFTEAAFQLGRLRRGGALDVRGKLLLSQCWVELGLYQEALGAVEDILRETEDVLALKQKASIFYLESRFLDLRDFLKPLVERYPGEPRLWMFLGHAEHHLNNPNQAAEAYERWRALEPEMSLAWLYLGKELLSLKRTQESLPVLSRAAELFFREEAYEDMREVLNLLRHEAPESALLLALEGKAAYLEKRYDLALEFFHQSRELGSEDPAVDFLEGIILKERGDRESAYALFRRACEKEPSYDLFWFRAAELAYLLDSPEALDLAQRAVETGPANPWCWNVLGLCQTEAKEKLAAFQKAHDLDPSLEDPALNLAWYRHKSGQTAEALHLLGEWRTPRAYNLMGNIHSELGEWEQAEDCYTRALKLDPEYHEARANLRLPLRKQGKMGFLDEILYKLLEKEPNNPEFLLDAADTAFTLGDWPRGELALRVLLENDPRHQTARRLLIAHYLAIRRYPRAREELDQAQQILPEVDWSDLEQRWLNATHTRIQCASCPQHWYLPHDFPDPGRLRLVGEPPSDLPAGKSPVTGLVYCVACAQHHVENGRFLCPESGRPLELDKGLVYLIKRGLERDEV